MNSTNQKIINVLVFATGAAIGSLVTWKLLKTKYERMIQDEVNAFKKDYIRCMGESKLTRILEEIVEDDACEDETEEPVDPVVTAYHALTSRYNNTSDTAENDEEGDEGEVPIDNGPYVIEPQDYGDGNYNHNLACLTYYADGVLTDSWDVELDIEETIGEEAIQSIGKYAEDVVHVRNEQLQTDYEVVRDPRTYTEVLAMSPSTVKDEY